MISQGRLERYSDFVDPERRGMAYDPRAGLGRALSVLTPDPKGIVLLAMGQGIYFASSRLHKRVLDWIEELGLPRRFPITEAPVWSYVELKRNDQKLDGSLVRIGAVVRQVHLQTLEDFRTGYIRSEPSSELVTPLVQNAVEFVYRARSSNIPHRYDSMVRILGGLHSKNDQLKPDAVYRIIRFLIDHPGNQRRIDIATETGLAEERVTDLFDDLSVAGIIDFQSPSRDIEGNVSRGWSIYRPINARLQRDFDYFNVYVKLQEIKPYFRAPGILYKVLGYIQANPTEDYEGNNLSKKLGVERAVTADVLSGLQMLGYLSKFNSVTGRKKSLASANELTRLFYHLVLEPAKETVDTLSPGPIRNWDRFKVALFLQNYQEERSARTVRGSNQARDRILLILPNDGQMKLSHLYELFNTDHEPHMQKEGLGTQLNVLIKAGKVEKTKPGFYRRVS
ncbi:hypothetical protein HYS97_03145 [Candidatus Daviesbacteria bacterium]|nr:hypothetical protein [Candidatus Daviesbacteria bacterium]